MQAAYAPGLTQIESSKLMSYSLSVRGFYDDNITTANSKVSTVKDSFGIDVRPSASLNLTTLQQTYIGATYTYGLRYFTDRQPHAGDHSHEFDARLEHEFTERYKVSMDDSFVYAQEPEVIGDLGVLQRSNSSVYRNNADVSFSGQLSELFGVTLAYDNAWYDYQRRGANSYAALLNRFEHSVRLDTRWVLDPKMTLRVGYRFTALDFTGNDEILFAGSGLYGRDRNNTAHTVFTGVDYSFNARLKSSLDVGARFTEYDHAVAGNSTVSPFVSANVTYVYKEGSYAQTGVTIDRQATDQTGSSVSQVTSDSFSISPYLSISHKITPRLTGTGLIRYTQLTYNGGTLDKQADNFIALQLGADYKVSEHWYVTSNYNFDNLSSDALLSTREYTRNRVFLGVTAKY